MVSMGYLTEFLATIRRNAGGAAVWDIGNVLMEPPSQLCRLPVDETAKRIHPWLIQLIAKRARLLDLDSRA